MSNSAEDLEAEFQSIHSFYVDTFVFVCGGRGLMDIIRLYHDYKETN